ncbi:MAG TPA: DedA family protein [Thermoleophilia bacterium]|nr:DedA family protein [Thermoleophilia bacterium]
MAAEASSCATEAASDCRAATWTRPIGWFAGRGQTAVFVTRMLPGVRSFISLPAGVARMPFVRFAVLTTAGSIPWNLALAYVGYVFGANWERLQGYFHRSDLVFYTLSACVAIAVIAWRWWGRSRARTGTQR